MRSNKNIAAAIALACITSSSALYAGTFKLGDTTLVAVDGSLSGLYLLSSNNGNNGFVDNGKDIDAMSLSDFVLNFDAGNAKDMNASFSASLGVVNPVVVGSQAPAEIAEPTAFNANVFSAAVTVYPIKELGIELGQIATTIGYESAISSSNGNITQGLLWNAQPTFYPGLRLKYDVGAVQLFVEANSDSSQGSGNAFAAGVSGEAGKVNFGATYYDGQSSQNIVDLIASTEINDIGLGINADLFILDDPGANQDQVAFGTALFISPIKGDIESPIRFEFISAGTSGLYQTPGGAAVGDSAFTITLTPTIKFGKNATLRAEFSYTKTKELVFSSTDQRAQDNNIGLALQTTYKF